ncbi:Ig-like domain-containing protein, partial [Escherichia coli]|uniref:Ig-like domain-containing protein n=1 Tax=Escherichia coli TaxID=562 RepID=UPI0028568AAF
LITLVAKDSFGNLVPFQQVTLSAPTPSIILTGPAATDGNGVWRGTAKSALAQTQTLTANLGAIALSRSIQFVPGPPAAINSSVTAGAQSTVANGQSSVNLVVQLADAANNAVANQNVTLAIGGSNNMPGALSGATDAAGQWRTTLTSTRAENKALVATA